MGREREREMGVGVSSRELHRKRMNKRETEKTSAKYRQGPVAYIKLVTNLAINGNFRGILDFDWLLSNVTIYGSHH